MDLHLRDRAYLVTGGSRGLGFAAAQTLLAEGACVLLSGPHEATAAAAAERLARAGASEDRVAWVPADNADPNAPDLLLAAAEARFGRLDGALISVGGIETVDDAWDRIAAGASLLQGYTGFIYGGGWWAKHIHDGLAVRLREGGFASLSDAVGSGSGKP